MHEEKYRPFVVTAIVGCVLWIISGGFIHAYVISPDWEKMGDKALENLLVGRPFVSLVAVGFIFGLTIEVAKFCAALLRSEGGVIFAPIAVGAGIGAIQGSIIATDIWGFGEAVQFRAENTRIVAGLVCGGILTVPAIMIGIGIRQAGR